MALRRYVDESRFSPSHRPVQAAILDGLGQVGGLDICGSLQVCNGAGDLEDAVMGAGGEPEMIHRLAQKGLGLGVQGTEIPQVAAPHVRVAVDAPVLTVALPLNTPAAFHPLADYSAG